MSAGYVPPRLDDLAKEPSGATEDLNAPLLSATDQASHVSSQPAAAAAAHIAIPVSSNEQQQQARHGGPDSAIPFGYPDLASSAAVLGIPTVPDAANAWKKEHRMLQIWLLTSALMLVIFAPFFLSTGLFISAQLGALLGIFASMINLSSACSFGINLAAQVKAVYALGLMAAVMDSMGVLMDMLIISATDCEADDGTCNSIVGYVLFFAMFLSGHAYLSYTISQRAKQVHAYLNPVTSGVLTLA